MAYSIINQGSTLTYNFTGTTTTPSVEFSGKTSFSTAISSMSIGSEYTWYVSTITNRDTTVTEAINRFDGIISDKQNTPVKGTKAEPSIDSTQVTLSSGRGSALIFNVLYNTQSSGSYNDESFKIKIVDKIGSGFESGEALKLSYFYYGEGGDTGLQSGGEYQVNSNSPSTGSDSGYVRLYSTNGTNLNAVHKFEINNEDLRGVDYTELYELVFNRPESLLTIRKENSNLSNVYSVTGGTGTATMTTFECTPKATTTETFSVEDGL